MQLNKEDATLLDVGKKFAEHFGFAWLGAISPVERGKVVAAADRWHPLVYISYEDDYCLVASRPQRHCREHILGMGADIRWPGEGEPDLEGTAWNGLAFATASILAQNAILPSCTRCRPEVWEALTQGKFQPSLNDTKTTLLSIFCGSVELWS